MTVPAGSTIIQATQALGVHVPHFCWHPGLSVAGVCRFCMVKIEGVPKLQIACNTPVTEGMKVDTVNAEVKDAHKWALEFHLINHPLDCPICDQAGECELQNYYMKVGKYESQMEEDKVLKPKALDVGPTLVLDTERCILCSRCVRFEDEVTKTGGLGIFNRGDRAVIGTYGDRKITHNYSYNLADVCPVGAFTAKDFRFKCRVWFLKETKSVCPGCSTGCNVTLYQNKNQREYYRLKPRLNEEVNGHWMCDYGRSMYEHLNVAERLGTPVAQGAAVNWPTATSHFFDALQDSATGQSVAVVLTPQYTSEEYETILDFLSANLGASKLQVYVWRNAQEKRDAFDGLLFRGDLNPNSKGLEDVLARRGVRPTLLAADFSTLAAQKPRLTLIFGPEVEKAYTQFADDLNRFAELPRVVYFGNSLHENGRRFWLRIPTRTYAEKDGTFVNFNGRAQRIRANQPVFAQLPRLEDFFRGAPVSHVAGGSR